MAAVRTSLVKRRHAYTSADIPWSMDVDDADAEDVMRHGRWRLFHYLSGGGMSAFGRPSGRELQLRVLQLGVPALHLLLIGLVLVFLNALEHGVDRLAHVLDLLDAVGRLEVYAPLTALELNERFPHVLQRNGHLSDSKAPYKRE